jgi:hydrophobic/amphiphilic exporter-1 (mainly G- bacteria), HAE1 family
LKLADGAIRRPVLTSVVFLILIILGAISFVRLPVDLMPDVSWPSITVRTNYSGVGPEEIERLITEPIERALGTVPGIEEITSTSSEGSSVVRVSFTWGQDLGEAAEDIRSRLDRLRGMLPEDSEPPVIFKFDLSQFPIVFLAVSGDMNPRDLRYFVEEQIQYRLERVPGVAAADIRGGLRREIQVRLSRDRLHALGVTPENVLTALRRENINLPAGQVYEGDFEVLLRTQGEFADVGQIADSVVMVRNGVPVHIRDIGRVEDGYEEVRDLTRIDGRPGIRMAIRKQSGANTVTVARQVQKEVENINRDFPQISVWTISDSSIFIERSINNVRQAAMFGAILAIFVLLLFLRNFRSAMIVAVAIPVSVIGAFLLMYSYGFTLNIMTFGALALGVGMLVDSAIVVLENIYRHREAGLDKKEAARLGTSEVGPAIIAAALTTLVVFLPVIFIGGMSGVMYQQLAYVVAFSLICALVVAMTLVPVLASRFIRVRQPDSRSLISRFVGFGGWLLERLDQMYQDTIYWALDHRKTVVFATILVFGGALLLLPLIGVEMMPEADEGEIRISFELPPGTQLSATDAVARQLEAMIQERVPEAERVLTEVGSSGGWSSAAVNSGSLRVILVPQRQRERSSQEVVNSLRGPLSSIPGVIARGRAGGGIPMFQRAMQSGDDRVSVEVRGHNLNEAYALAVEVRRIMETVPGISDARLSRSEGRPENQIYIDRERASSLGLSVSQIANTLRTTVGGTRATLFRQGGDEFNILVRYDEEDRRDLQSVLSTPVQTPSGKLVPLGSLVQLRPAEGPVSIQRKDQERMITVSGNLAGRDLGSVISDVRARLQDFHVPLGFAVLMGGEYEEQQRGFRDLMLSMVLAILLVYLVMAAQFESFRYPFIILLSIPLAVIGVALMLFLTATTFNMQGFIGIIMLAGIVVNNAIVLVDYMNLLRREYKFSLREALAVGGRRRLRPILMTTMTTILGLVPMSLGIGEGGELQAPMARVVIGGLLSSTFITLIFIPTIYMMMEGKRVREESTELIAEPEAAT